MSGAPRAPDRHAQVEGATLVLEGADEDPRDREEDEEEYQRHDRERRGRDPAVGLEGADRRRGAGPCRMSAAAIRAAPRPKAIGAWPVSPGRKPCSSSAASPSQATAVRQPAVAVLATAMRPQATAARRGSSSGQRPAKARLRPERVSPTKAKGRSTIRPRPPPRPRHRHDPCPLCGGASPRQRRGALRTSASQRARRRVRSAEAPYLAKS